MQGYVDRFMDQHIYKYIYYIVFDGVAMFFVLSGFLIGGILIKIINTQGINWKIILNFWKRRWFRILPNYFLILIVLLIIGYYYTDEFTLTDKYKYFIFTQNLVTEHPKFFGEAWSLSIEEWFYLLIPIIIFLFFKVLSLSARKAVLFTAIGFLICVTLFRYYRYVTLDIDSLKAWDVILRKQVFTRFDSLMFGIIGAYMYFYHKLEWNKFKIRCVGSHIQIWINGHKTADLKDEKFKFSEGSIALQHHGKGDTHYFRNIRIREIRN